METSNNLVYLQNNEPVTTSKKIAERFKKRHADVLRAIKGLECSEEFHLRNFAFMLETRELPNGGQAEDPYCIVSEKGFTLLVMGFTGKQAMAFKEEYIEAFDKMRKSLNKPQTLQGQLLAGLEAANKLRLIAEEEKRELEAKNEIQKQVISEQAPKVEYHDEVLKSKKGITTTVVADGLGMTARRLNSILKEKGIQYKVDGTWVLTAKHKGKGYTKSNTYHYRDSLDRPQTSISTNWTEKGRKFIIETVEAQTNP